MSGHWRFYVAAFLLAGFLASPASSNPLTDLFDFPPKEAAAPVPAQPECVPQPARSTAPGRHWVYHLEGHRKCWFEADAATVLVRKQIRHDAARRSTIIPEENEAALQKRPVLDARAQMLSAPLTATSPQSGASALEVVNTASVVARDAATPVSEASSPILLTADQLAPARATPRPVDVEALLAASTFDEDNATFLAPSVSAGPPIAVPDDWQLMAAPAGMILITLGFVLLAGSLLASRFLTSRMAPIHRASVSDFALDRYTSGQKKKSERRLASTQTPEFLRGLHR